MYYDPRPEDCDKQPDIDVSPLYYDFPNTGVGSANGVIVTISNMGNADLTINSLDLSLSNNDFYILNPPILPFTITPQSGSEIEIIFEPLTVGSSASTLEIGCDNIGEPFVEVEFYGMGIVLYYTISEQIENILDFIYISVDDGSLVGKGPGKSGKNRLKTFIKMVENVQKHINKENYTPAGNKIDVVLKRCSEGSSGFVGGEAVEKLVEMLLRLKDNLERGDCENIAVIDEAHVFSTNGSLRFLLDQQNVDTSTIIVLDTTRTKFYLEGVDYTVSQIDNQTEIRIQPTGEIFNDGDQILRVDYNYNTCDWAIPETPIPDISEVILF